MSPCASFLLHLLLHACQLVVPSNNTLTTLASMCNYVHDAAACLRECTVKQRVSPALCIISDWFGHDTFGCSFVCIRSVIQRQHDGREAYDSCCGAWLILRKPKHHHRHHGSLQLSKQSCYLEWFWSHQSHTHICAPANALQKDNSIEYPEDKLWL